MNYSQVSNIGDLAACLGVKPNQIECVKMACSKELDKGLEKALSVVSSLNPDLNSEEQLRSWETRSFFMTCPLVQSVKVPVYNRQLELIDYRIIYGPATHFLNPVIFRLFIANPNKWNDSYEMLKAFLLKYAPSLKPVPGSDGWTITEEDGMYIDIIMAADGYDWDDLRLEFSRFQLWYHMNKKTRNCGMYKTAIVKGGSKAKADGQGYARKSSFVVMPGMHLDEISHKFYALRNYKTFIREQMMVFKGMIEFLSDYDFAKLLAEHDLPDTVQVIIPEISVKLKRDEHIVDMEYFSIFEAMLKNKAAISLQAATRVNLTPYGKKLMVKLFGGQIVKMNSILEDTTSAAGLKYTNREYREFSDACEGTDEYEEWGTILMENAEDRGSSAVERAFLPRRAEEALNADLPRLCEMTKKVYVERSCTSTVLYADIAADECIAPYLLRDSGAKIGDWVLLMRSPNTGIEWVMVKIVGFSRYLHTKEGGPTGLDFDYDPIGCVVVDEPVVYPSTTKALKKASVVSNPVPQDALVATLKAITSKHLITRVDTLLTMVIEMKMGDVILQKVREYMQAVIDSVKHPIELMGFKEFCKSIGIKVVVNPYIYKLMKGQISTSKRQGVIGYNYLITMAREEGSSVDWLNEIILLYKYILCENKFLNEADHNEKHRVSPRSNWDSICVKAGYPEWAVQPDGYEAATFDKDVVESNSPAILKTMSYLESKAGVVKFAADILGNKSRHAMKDGKWEKYANAVGGYHQFVDMLRDRNVKPAYTHLRENVLSKIVAANPELAGDAIKYIFLSITTKCGKLGRNRTDNYKVISYLPTSIGKWDIIKANKYMGGLPKMNYVLVSQDVMLEEPTTPTPSPEEREVVVANTKISEVVQDSLVDGALDDAAFRDEVCDFDLEAVYQNIIEEQYTTFSINYDDQYDKKYFGIKIVDGTLGRMKWINRNLYVERGSVSNELLVCMIIRFIKSGDMSVTEAISFDKEIVDDGELDCTHEYMCWEYNMNFWLGRTDQLSLF